MTERDISEETTISSSTPTPTSITHIFDLGEQINDKETRLAVAKFTTVCNEDEPGWSTLRASRDLQIEEQTLRREIEQLKAERRRVVDENKSDVKWVRELFRVRDRRVEERMEDVLKFRAVDGDGGGVEVERGDVEDLEMVLGRLVVA